MVDDRPYDVGPVETAAAAAKVILEIVVELEGLAILQRQHTVESPAIFQLLPISAHLGKLVGEIPGKAVRYVEVRWSVFQIGTRTVVRLRSIGFEIFPIAGIIKGPRPHVVRDGGDPMPVRHAQAKLKGVVV